MMKLVVFVAILTLTHGQDCPEVDCPPELACEYGLKKDVSGCSICECEALECKDIACEVGTICRLFDMTFSPTKITNCVDPTLPEACQLPHDQGRCSSSEEMFYYHPELGDCVTFNYGGCDGNDNRFSNHKECLQKCNPSKYEEEYTCRDIQCEMECPSGLKQDKKGCDICECQEPEPEPEVGPKLLSEDPNCPLPECYIHCEEGFKRDEQGCALCECRECSSVVCFMECEHGFRRDQDGCNLCECLAEGECNEPVCMHECEFGFRKDKQGCDTCRCKENPCHMVSCDLGETCEVEENMPVCVKGASLVRFGCSKLQCTMFCDHGFEYDQFGCEICSCREEAAEPCPEIHCPCRFGNAFKTDGCMSCDCLEDPCKSQKCDKRHVCEHQRNHTCPECRVLSRCIEFQEVQRVKVDIELFHDPVENLDIQLVKEELLTKLVNMTQLPHESLAGVKASKKGDVTVLLEFHIVEADDLVSVYENFKKKIEMRDETAVQVAGTELMPEKESLKAEFSTRSQPALYRGEMKEEDGGLDDTTTYIIIGCVVGGVVLLAVIVIVAVAVKKTKTAAPKKKNIIYKAANRDEMA